MLTRYAGLGEQCFRCGSKKPKGMTGAGISLSRLDCITAICSSCGRDEALGELMGRWWNTQAQKRAMKRREAIKAVYDAR